VLREEGVARAGRDPLATAFFAAPLAAGAWTLAWVEALSATGLVGSRGAWVAFWAATAALLAASFGPVRRAFRARPRRPPRALNLAIPVAVLALTLAVALASAPNNWDSLVYHNARVMQWREHGSVAPWETPNERQLRMPPLASYFTLALFGLTRNDVLFNLVQWGFFGFAIAAAALLATRLVPSDRAGPWAALLVATTPMAVLQASSTQNDLAVAGYLLAAAFFLVRAFEAGEEPARDLALGGAAVGLALATKGTAYLLAVPLVLAVAGAAARRIMRGSGRERRAWASGLAAAASLVVLPSAGYWWRSAGALGSPVGHVSEIVRPAAFTSRGLAKAPALVVSQISRAGLLQLGQLRVVGLPARAFASALTRAHAVVGIGVDEPGISRRAPLRSAEEPALNHEDTAPSTATFLVLLAATAIALVGPRFPGRGSVLAAFAVGWAAWLAVAVFVRWMPWNARLHLPALILLAVPAGALVAQGLGRPVRVALAAALVLQALPAALLNSSRPLAGFATRSILATSRWEDYFRNQPTLQADVEHVLIDLSRRCHPGETARLDVDGDAPEYPLWVGAPRLAPGVGLHTGSPRPGDLAPCAVVRSTCTGGRAFCLGEAAP
jgi:hypothetical protein